MRHSLRFLHFQTLYRWHACSPRAVEAAPVSAFQPVLTRFSAN